MGGGRHPWVTPGGTHGCPPPTHGGGGHLGEVADDVGALAVHLGQEVEDEGLDVEVEGLVVQEELGQQAEVLAVDLGGVVTSCRDISRHIATYRDVA